MQLVERHVINRHHKHWQECDKLAFLSKNLWNAANYVCRQHFFANGAKLDFNSLYHATNYNKIRAQYQSVEATAKIKQITHKRNCRVDNYLHTASRLVIDWCVSNSVGTLIIGKNDGMKNGIKLGKKNNQQFVNIPHGTLVGMLTYKAELVGIKVVVTEESYTSKASALDNDEIPVYAQVKKEPKFSGSRVKRGLYRTATRQLINADVNGSMNIIRKVIPDAFSQGIKALPFMPLVVDPLRTQKPTYLLAQAFQAVV